MFNHTAIRAEITANEKKQIILIQRGISDVIINIQIPPIRHPYTKGVSIEDVHIR